MSLHDLKNRFPAEDVEWRVQRSGFSNGKPWAMVLAYITNRAIMQRLDDVVGPENWMNRFMECGSGAVECGIGIRVGDDWVWKYDAAETTDIEAVKGGRSNSMKRAGVQWGIGRYLYKLETNFAECRADRPIDRNGWNQAKADGKTFYWKAPQLPAWALPGGEK